MMRVKVSRVLRVLLAAVVLGVGWYVAAPRRAPVAERPGGFGGTIGGPIDKWVEPLPMPTVSPEPVVVSPAPARWTCARLEIGGVDAVADVANVEIEDQALLVVIAYPYETWDPLFGQRSSVMDAAECAARRWRLGGR